ncbi:hypothetical protein [Gloeothece verrucosa]|uniref:Uncharacterized protein n=1 Tax=Gloeothece verrucosa (strain PCC 7822) TaxID=497965 RepID=E0UJM2_GLOV7|nr:hypothetical protein [Gloeothece verrucosa]ADN12266.1 conserved hypothetical protein [Gloeothece verrucosa PCC 7822]
MNSFANPSFESPRQGKTTSQKSETSLPESVLSTKSQTVMSQQTSALKVEPEELKMTSAERVPHPSQRQLPIPAPSQPEQYRAIGLIQGHYQRSSDQLNRGNLLTADGTLINAVMLGRVIGLFKKLIDLEEPHLWVVYPRTRDDEQQLHVQIVGVWEPETLCKDEPQPLANSDDQTLIKHGYFSVRGEVIFASAEKQMVIVKIRQAPKQEQEKPKFFKLILRGTLPARPVSRFWDLKVELQGNDLVIQEATDLGFIKNKKSFNNRKKTLTNSRSRKPFNNSRSLTRSYPENKSQQPQEIKFTPKPSKIIKKKID